MKKLYGIGTGPGDKELLTIKAVKKIQGASVVFAPSNKDKNIALDTVEEYIQYKKVILLDFPMGKVTEKDYINAAQIIYTEIPEGEYGVYLTIGDPMIYSTFIYIMEKLDKNKIQVEIIPGIPSFVLGAAQSKIPLTVKGDKFLLMDEFQENMLDNIDTLCILKTMKDKEKILDVLENKGFSYAYIKRVSLKDEKVLTKKDEIIKDKDYLSFIIGRRKADD